MIRDDDDDDDGSLITSLYKLHIFITELFNSAKGEKLDSM